MWDLARAIEFFNCKLDTLSTGGLVLGMSNTVVTPPQAAAADPDCQSSFSISPGIPKMDMRIDDAWEYIETAGIDGFAGWGQILLEVNGNDGAIVMANPAA